MSNLFFNDCLILDVHFAQSKAGNPYARLSFLVNQTLQVYEIMVFGDAVGVAAGLSKGSRVSLGFDVMPDRNGGVRVELVAVGAVEGV